MTEMELFVRSVLHHGADFMVSMQGQDSKQLMVKVGTVAAVLASIWLSKKAWGGYRNRFKFSKKLVYIGSKKLATDGGWGGMLLLPSVIVETVLFPMYMLLGCFTPRSEEEKNREFNERRDVAKAISRQSKLQENINSRIMELEDAYSTLERYVDAVNSRQGKILSEIKKDREIDQSARKIAMPAGSGYDSYYNDL